MKEALTQHMQPAPVGGGFEMEGYWVWCGSVIRAEDGRYHMFASRWPKRYPMHPGWLVASEVVRAVSDRPEGPTALKKSCFPREVPSIGRPCYTQPAYYPLEGQICAVLYGQHPSV